MIIDPNWAMAVLTALGMGAGAGAWVQKRIDDARLVMPLLRPRWRESEQGFLLSVEIVNRLDEDIEITCAEARAPFLKVRPREFGSVIQIPVIEDFDRIPSPMRIALLIKANSSRDFHFHVSGVETPRWLCLTISSSLNTIRRKRLIMRKDSSC